MQFVHQALTWGFLLALLPVLIHLINLVRRRRVKWAAMEFLLRSYRKHRKWIWLKQWLLLLLRMAGVALAVAMLAQWVSQQEWLALLGGRSTHHYILLDDSYSMSERTGSSSAFDQARRAVGRIAAQAVARETLQKVTLVRFSRAAAAQGSAETAVGRLTDLNAEIVDGRFDQLLEERQRQLEVTQLAVGPREALELVNQILRESLDESNVVYLLSDFREAQWGQPAELRRALRETQQFSKAIHLVRCSRQRQANLAVVGLDAGDETRAAGVPFFVQVSVRNFGTETARRVPVRVRTTSFDPEVTAAAEPGKPPGKLEEPPALLLEEVPPGETVARRVQLFFPRPGPQIVEALLPEDAVAADNRRWCVVDLPTGEPVLIVDGSLNQRNAYFLAAAFQPGQRAQSGVRPDIQPVSALRDMPPQSLAAYRAVYLLDVDRLDERARENLETYARDGGGVAVFAGERLDLSHYSRELFRDGQGFFPLPLRRIDQLPVESFDNAPDLVVENHPVFRAFAGDQSRFLSLVAIDRYLRPPDDWRPNPQSTVRILATLRNRQPLVVERQFGQGRVVAFLSTLAPDWNNWAHDPSFVVTVLQLQSYLAAAARQEPSRTVGSSIEVNLDARKYRDKVAFVRPGSAPERPVVVERLATRAAPDAGWATAQLGGPGDRQGGADTQRSGVYEAWSQTLEGSYDVRRFALNVEPQEGDLALAPVAALRDRLQPLRLSIGDVDEFIQETEEQAGYNRSLLLMMLLIALLLGEQLLAFFASYHPSAA